MANKLNPKYYIGCMITGLLRMHCVANTLHPNISTNAQTLTLNPKP